MTDRELAGLAERADSILARQDYTFAECSFAEEVIEWVREAAARLRAVEKERDEARRNLETEILSHEMTAKRLDEALPKAEQLPLEIERKEYWKGRYEQTPSAQKAQDNG